MVYTTCVEYVYQLYKKYKECNYGSRYNLIESLAREKPFIISSCKIWQKVRCGRRNVLLSERKKVFEFTHCIDVTDLVDFDSKINPTVPLLVKIKVEFADPETEEAYKENVEKFSTQVRRNYGDNVNITTDTLYKVSTFTNEKIISYPESFIHNCYALHWSLNILFWFNESFLYTIQTITIRKIVIVSRQIKNIL